MTLPYIDPIIFSIGPLSVRWYGLMYVLGFFATYALVKWQIKEQNFSELDKNFDNLNTVLILCVILGGRLGYVVFYNLSYYLENPIEIIATWNGGMSFHGACIALVVGGFLFCKKQGFNFWQAADIYTATIPVGLGLGRIGNLINGELYGRATDMPWGVIFPQAGNFARHPSQIYEALLEGLVLFIILWSCHKLPSKGYKFFPKGSILSLFIIGYGFFRIIIENFRQPDAHIGFVIGQITMGQILSFAMILIGASIWVFRVKCTNK